MIIFCFCSNEMQQSRIWRAKQKSVFYSVLGILHAVGGGGECLVFSERGVAATV